MRLKFKIKCDFNITFIYGKSDFLINYYARLEIIYRGTECVIKNVIKTGCKYKGY